MTKEEEVYNGALALVVQAYMASVTDGSGAVVVGAPGTQALRVEPIVEVIQGTRSRRPRLLLLTLSFDESIMHSIFRYLDGELNIFVFQVSAFAYEIENVTVCDALNSMTIGSCQKFMTDFLRECCPPGQFARVNASIVTVECEQFVVLYPVHQRLSAAIYVTALERFKEASEEEFLVYLEVLRIQYGVSSIQGAYRACCVKHKTTPFIPPFCTKLGADQLERVLGRVEKKIGPRANAILANDLIDTHRCLTVKDAADCEKKIKFVYDYN